MNEKEMSLLAKKIASEEFQTNNWSNYSSSA